MDTARNWRDAEHVANIRQVLHDHMLVIVIGVGIAASAIQPPITWIRMD
jgi:hypothetical protein